MKRLLIVVSPLIIILLSSCNFTLAADITPPPDYQEPTAVETQAVELEGPMYPLVAPDPSAGAAIFAEKCAPCHGIAGLGDGPQADGLPNPVTPIGTKQVARQAVPYEWYRVVTNGNLERFMPPFSSLTDRQRWDLIAYSLNLSMSQDELEHARDLYLENCSGCHGERGEGDGLNAEGMNTPDFKDQEFMSDKSAEYLYQSVTDGVGTMHAFESVLSDDERWSLADYLRSLTFKSVYSAETLEGGQTLESTGQPASTPLAQDTNELETLSASQDEIGSGSVSGYVMNMSGGELDPGLEVFLHGFDQMQVVITETTTLADDGSYQFSEIEMPVGRVFLTTIDYDGWTYGSEIAEVQEGDQTIELPIEVYETTTDTTGLFADRLHMFFEQLDENTLRVVELFIISNSGNNTVVATEEGTPVLNFSLPAEAANLEFQDGIIGDRYVITEDGFGDTLPIRPGMGNYQVLFSYEMPFQSKFDLVHTINLQTDALVLLVPEDSVEIKGENIEDAGVRDMQGVIYHMYNGSSLKAGDELRLSITGQRASIVNSISSSGVMIGFAVLGIVLIISGVWAYRRMVIMGVEDDETPVELPSLDEPQDANAIMDAILALDDLYKNGQLPETAYYQRRDQLKDQLAALIAKEGKAA